MNIKVAKKEISNSIKAYLAKDEKGEYLIPTTRQRPILLMGPPGVGKTAIMEQVASENKIALVSYTITHHTRESAVGVAQIVNMHYNKESFQVTSYTMSEIIAEIYHKMNRTGLNEGILFLDEINCVDESLSPSILQFLQFKTFGTHSIPDGWVIVVAGNPSEYNDSVKDFDMVTLDRLKRMEIAPDFDVWREYAFKARVNNAIISYLYNNRDDFYVIGKNIADKQFVTARGWEDLSDMLTAYEKYNLEVSFDFIQEYVQHPHVASSFYEYYNRYVSNVKNMDIKTAFETGDADKVMAQYSALEEDMKTAFMIKTVHELAEIVYECEYQKLYAYNVVKMAEEVGKIYETSRSNYRSNTYSVTEGMRQMLTKQIEANLVSRNQISAMRNAIKFVDDIALKYARGTDEMLFIAEIYKDIQKEFEPIDSFYEAFLNKTKVMFNNAFYITKAIFADGKYDEYMDEFRKNYHIVNFINNELKDEYGYLIKDITDMNLDNGDDVCYQKAAICVHGTAR